MSRVSLRNTLRGNPKTKLPSHSNSVFFPSNNEKRTTQCPTKSTETQATSARTQFPQTIYRSGDEQSAPDTSCLYPCPPRQQICPAAADPQRGQERCWRGIGDRNPLSLSNRPREEQIKSTHTMWYSPLVKPIKTTTANRSFLIIKAKEISKRRSISRLQVKK